MTLTYQKVHDDGTVETLRPHKFKNGKYQVVIEVDDLGSVKDMIAKDEAFALRMSGPKSKGPAVIQIGKVKS